VIRDFLVIEMPQAGNKRRTVVLPRPVDLFLLSLEGGEHVVRVIFHHEVLDGASFRTALRLDVNIRHVLSSLLSEANGGSYHSDEADVHHASKGGDLLEAWST
jgi:hypothetical protein